MIGGAVSRRPWMRRYRPDATPEEAAARSLANPIV
jgi:hypothetical protein